ncbi:MAG: Glu-tRNA(Gln) amidotransferase subunit GatE [Candidatus Odinarchaeota archaeon]|nr:Glu-tRNA(Gln) amidotransferase subunit GatE [Candidatus Odinarchaeota archaeon]
MEKIDYEEIGLKVGLEIHQQLNTATKLFCNCPTILRDENPDFTIIRELRPTQSELGEIDPAAKFEYEKGRKYIYEGYNDSVCLVECDDEPPHKLDKESLEITLTVATLMNASIVDEVHVMRKIVIDGSNTSGFQRTAIIALGGFVEDLDTKEKIGIQTICLEEDAARKIREDAKTVTYRLDRLGIPLIEIATAPDIKTPEQARRVALRIGQILRATRKVKRGLGTIRQDVNVSIKDGAITEIKGVQKLDLVEKVVENEVRRQLGLLEIRNELKKRGVKEKELKTTVFLDVTDIFENTESKVVRNALKKKGKVYGLALPKFKGILGRELQPNRRFGTELADYVKFWAGLKGIFHSDELPNYGITEEEVKQVKEKLKMKENDAFVLVVGPEEKVTKALNIVVNRCIEALKGVPPETRTANPDGTTKYSRPRPGAQRMYPETDVPPTQIPEELLERIRSNLPELPEHKLNKFIQKYKLNEELANGIIRSQYLDVFEQIIEEINIPAVLVATTFDNTLKSLRRDGIPIENLLEKHFIDLFKAVAERKIAKEAIPEVLQWLSKNPEKDASDAIKALNLEGVSEEELKRIIDDEINNATDVIKTKQERAFGTIMGRVMKKVRGKIDGATVSKLLKQKLEEKIRELQK